MRVETELIELLALLVEVLGVLVDLLGRVFDPLDLAVSLSCC